MYSEFMILGGAGLVGLQVCRHLVLRMQPRRIVVASLFEAEARDACTKLEEEFGDKVAFVPDWGNLFVPTRLASKSREDILSDVKTRREMLEFVYDDFEAAYKSNHLAQVIKRHRPEVIVDCVNTATGFSYQDVFDGAAKVREWIGSEGYAKEGLRDLDAFLLSQTTPQIIRHVRIVHRATTEFQTRVYLKVGTTGTGGMGLNIPYTHSEDKPSKKLLAKNETAFGHSGLLFLLARTPHAPIVKEVKPAAMIGYRGVRVRDVADKHGNRDLYAPLTESGDIGDSLDLSLDAKTFEKVGTLRVPVVDTGENGVFTRGEFAAITAHGQMEFITPEEIARTVVHEIRGANTGNDIMSALDASVLNPTYKAGLLRNAALTDLAEVEAESEIPSIALGKLGPPELSKLLFEAQLLKAACSSLQAVAHPEMTPAQLAQACSDALESSGVQQIAPSIGIPVVLPDGKTIMRGPRINVPEVVGHRTKVAVPDRETFEGWVKKGWIDLRAANMGVWQERVRSMLASRGVLRDQGSAASTIRTYSGNHFEIGEVVAWIFNNELEGYRVK